MKDVYLRNRENPSVKMSLRNILLERIFLVLSVAADMKSLEECGTIFGAAGEEPEQSVWMQRLYVLLTECFGEWAKDSLKTKFRELDKRLFRLSKTVYFTQTPSDDIDHREFEEAVRKAQNSPAKGEFGSIPETLAPRSAQNSINRASLSGLPRTANTSKDRQMAVFEELEKLKTGYLNCVFSNTFSFKDLTRSQKAFAACYNANRKEIQAFLKAQEQSPNPKYSRTRMNLTFCNIVVPYLSKTQEDMTTQKGLQRVRANFLGFFQAAYREYPSEYVRMVHEDQGVHAEPGKEDIFVIKGEGVFGKRDLDKLYSRKERAALDFSQSFHETESIQREARAGSEMNGTQKRSPSDTDVSALASELEQLVRVRDQLRGQVAELTATHRQLLAESQNQPPNLPH